MTQSSVEQIAQNPKADGARRSLVRSGGMVIVAAMVFVTIAYLIADAATGGLWVTPMGGDTPEEIPLGVALFMTVIGGLVGTGFAFVARRFAPRPRVTFVVVCGVALVLFGLMPLTAAEETATGVWLNVVHLSAALPIVGGLALSLPTSRA